MRIERNPWPMNPIALVETTTATRRAVLGALATDPAHRPRACGQPLMASAARFSISSGGTSSTWVATLQRCPNGSSN